MKIKHGFSYEKDGWTYMSVKGDPKERGHAYGYLSAQMFAKVQKMLKFFVYETYGRTWEYFITEVNDDFKEMTKEHFPEYYEEMQGIADGCNAAGTKTTFEEIIAWNFYMSMPYWYSVRSSDSASKEGGGSQDRCSAFMAVGDYTEDGNIVCAHNSFAEFIDGQYESVILDLNPTKGHRFIMQTSPCLIWSSTDFFVTAAGIIGTETTIGGFIPYEKKYPIAYRIRKAMQYGDTLDDYVEILLKENSGDYANSWLFGDINTNEILRIELGLKYHNVERTKNGMFIGFNAPYDPKIRNLECKNTGFYDVRRHQGARLVRLNELMDKHKGKINIKIAQEIISDHHDVYLHKENPCSRTVCSHYDLDAREYMSDPGRPKPFSPHGAIDGCVVDTNLAKKMSFIARFGNSCGTTFNKTEFCDKHIQWNNYRPYLNDRLSQPWSTFSIANHEVAKNATKHNKTKRKNNADANNNKSKTRKR